VVGLFTLVVLEENRTPIEVSAQRTRSSCSARVTQEFTPSNEEADIGSGATARSFRVTN